MEKNNVEIERKYVILMPDVTDMEKMQDYTVSDIVQIYLNSHLGVTHRVRSRKYGERIEYTETKKIRMDKMSAIEEEKSISEEEFHRLSQNIRQGSCPLIKTRHTFNYFGQLFEIDVYPKWHKSAIMETELPSCDTEVVFPSFIKLIKEVTGDKDYSNASMSCVFPSEIF